LWRHSTTPSSWSSVEVRHTQAYVLILVEFVEKNILTSYLVISETQICVPSGKRREHDA